MREKMYTIEALNVAYEAIEQQIKFICENYIRNDETGEYEWKVRAESDLEDDEKLKVKAYCNALKLIEKIA